MSAARDVGANTTWAGCGPGSGAGGSGTTGRWSTVRCQVGDAVAQCVGLGAGRRGDVRREGGGAGRWRGRGHGGGVTSVTCVSC